MVDAVKYVVAQDDSLWNIMKKNGFPPQDWEKALNASYNSTLKSKLTKEKRSPDLIYKGEEFFLPKYNPAEIKDLLLQLDSKYESFRNLQKSADKLTANFAKIDDDKRKTKSRLSDARTTLREMDKYDNEMAKPDQGDPKGGLAFAKLVRQLTDKKRGELERLTADMEQDLKDMDNKENKAYVQKLTKMSKEISTALDTVEKEILATRTELANNMANPY